jgi:uncharacterized ion transporter superfamily protein YfcC
MPGNITNKALFTIFGAIKKIDMLKKVPHTYVIIFLLIAFCAVCTWFIPGGEFERERIVVNNVEREVIKPGSFQFIESQQTWQVFSAFFRRFCKYSQYHCLYFDDWRGILDMNESKSIDIGIYSFS